MKNKKLLVFGLFIFILMIGATLSVSYSFNKYGETVELHFYTNGGEKLDNVIFTHGKDTLLAKLPVPKKEGYVFKGWFIDETLETIPTKVSQLENDAGFLTQIPSEYVTESELESKGYITEHQSLENYATKEFVTESISNIDIPDTSSFITMQEVEAKGYINEIPEEYVTNDELRDAINSIDIPDVDLTNYYTKEETENLIPKDYVTQAEAENFATHKEVPAKQIFEALRKADIYVRYLSGERIKNYLKVNGAK